MDGRKDGDEYLTIFGGGASGHPFSLIYFAGKPASPREGKKE